MTEKDINLGEISPIIPNNLFKLINFELNTIIEKICNENNLNYKDISSKYSEDIISIGTKFGVKKRNRRVLPAEFQCMGRKLDSKQCTRGKRDKNNDLIATHVEIIDGNNYLVDDKKFVYTFNINNPEFLGILQNNKINKIEC